MCFTKSSGRLPNRCTWSFPPVFNRVQAAYLYFYTPRERSSGGYIGITLSVRLSVQIRVRPITFLWFDIGLPYLAHVGITMRQCVAYIHDPDTTLNFALKVKFIGFLTCIRVRAITFFFGLTLAYHIWHMGVSP